MNVTVDMPAVTGCSATACAYNVDRSCHARAITVGNGIHPGCDTFFKNADHTHGREIHAGVGACKVRGCIYNDDYECSASGIDVGVTGRTVSCLTYSPRP